MTKVARLSNLNAAGATDAALVYVPGGAVGIAFGAPAVLAAAFGAYP
jgi:hypothetical protein